MLANTILHISRAPEEFPTTVKNMQHKLLLLMIKLPVTADCASQQNEETYLCESCACTWQDS